MDHSFNQPSRVGRGAFSRYGSSTLGDLLRFQYSGCRAIHEKGGLNLADLTDEQQLEAEDDYRICARRGSDTEPKPKKRKRKMNQEDE